MAEQVKFTISFGQTVSRGARDELIAALRNEGASVTPKDEQAIDPETVIIVLKVISAGFTAAKAALDLSRTIRDWRKRHKKGGDSLDVRLNDEDKETDIDLDKDSDEDIDEWLQS